MKWMWWNLEEINRIKCVSFKCELSWEMNTVDAYQIYPSINLLKSRAQPKNISYVIPRTFTFFSSSMKWTNKFNYYFDRLMEALSTHFPFVFARVHSVYRFFLRLCIEWWLKLTFIIKSVESMQRTKRSIMKFSGRLLYAATVTRAYIQSVSQHCEPVKFSCTLFCMWIAMHKIYFVYLFNGVVLWWCADRVYFIVAVAVVVVDDVFMLLELVCFFGFCCSLPTYIVFNFLLVIFIDNHQLIEKE